MSQLTRYLNRLLLTRFAVVLFAVAGFAILFDLLDVGTRVLRRSDGTVWPLLRYIVIRLPSLVAELVPLVALVAGLLTVSDLLRFRELVVMWNAGLSRAGILLRLWPMVLLLMAGKLVIDDVLLPATVAELRSLRVGDFKAASEPRKRMIWLRSGTDILRLPADAAVSGQLRDLLVLRRDADGQLIERLEAETAEPVAGGWRLRDVTRRPASARPPEVLAELVWPMTAALDRVALMARLPRELRLVDLYDAVRADGYGVSTTEGHRTWLNARVAGPIGLGATLLLPFALARRFGRLGIMLPIWVQGLTLGFVYLVVNGVLLAFGEVGIVLPEFAAWTMPLVFAGLVAWVGGLFERRRPRPAGIAIARAAA